MLKSSAASGLGDNPATLASIGVVAACLAAAGHEAVGHGSACLVSGGRILRVTSVYFDCSAHTPLIALAGPFANFLVGSVALVACETPLALRNGIWRVFLLMLASFNLLWGAGYLVYSGALNVGDWANAARGLPDAAQPEWRAVAVAGGAILYMAILRRLQRIVSGFSTADDYGPSRAAVCRTQRLLRGPYGAAALSACVAAIAYGSADAVLQAALEVAIASAGLLAIQPRRYWAASAEAPAATSPIGLNWPVVALAAAVYAVFFVTLGRGLTGAPLL